MLKRVTSNIFLVRRAVRSGGRLAPLAGTVSQDGEIYRHCLVAPTGEVVAAVGSETIAELQLDGIAIPRNMMASIPTSSLPLKSFSEADVDGSEQIEKMFKLNGAVAMA